MATTYTLQSPPHAGAALALTVPANGDIVPTGSGIGLLVINSAAGTMTVVLPLPTVDGQVVTARTVTILASATWLIPLPSSVYGVGTVTVTYTGTLAAVGVAVISTPGT